MDVLEAEEEMMENIYPALYFSLPRLPARASKNQINERQISILWLLKRAKDKGSTLIINDVGKEIKLRDSDTTKIIKKLVELGFVRKLPSNKSEREKEVEIIQEGIKKVLKEREKRKEWFVMAFKNLNGKELEFLIVIFKKVIANLSKIPGK